MLHLMRKHAQSWIIKCTLGAIIVVFIFWYGWSSKAQRANRVAVVDGISIGIEEFRDVYDQLREVYRRQFGNALDEELIKSLNLKRQALDQIINRLLLIQEANRLNLRVDNDELLRSIEQVPAFQRDGRFHPEVYRRVLMRNRISPEMYEEDKKKELSINKLQSLIRGNPKVSEAEALDMYRWLKEKISLDYVVFTPATYTNVEVTSEEVEAYFSKHKKEYETPPMVKVRYLFLDFKGFEAEAKVSEEEVSTYFDLNKEDYASPKRVKARHILVEAGAKPEAVKAARKKALGVLKEARSGADFSKLAQKYSDDTGTRAKGGDLGFFTRDRMVKPFSDAAFAMKQGEIGELVRTRFGWHIIKVEAIQEAKEAVLAEAADRIRTKLSRDAARTLAFDRAEQINDACYEAGNISDVANINQLKVHETEPFRRDGPIKGIKEKEKFVETAFALDENEVSESIELSDGYYILQLVAKEPARIPDLKKVEERVRQNVIKDRKDELAKKDAGKFFNNVKDGAEFKEATSSRKLKAKSTDFFGRSGAISGIGSEPDILEAAFTLSSSKPFPDSVIKGKQGYYVIRFKARQEADEKEFEDEKSRITSSLLNQKRQAAIGEFLTHLREKSEITVEEGFFD